LPCVFLFALFALANGQAKANDDKAADDKPADDNPADDSGN